MSQIGTIAPTIAPDALDILLNQAPHRAGEVCRTLWDAQIPISGPVTAIITAHPGLDLLGTTRLAGLATDLDPTAFSNVIVRAAAPDAADVPALHVAATAAVGRPQVMRWITGNAKSVISEDNWRAVLPGLGGVTKSVPLAEEALFNLMKTRKRLTSELTGFVQLNPWFSRRFAVRYRRRMRGKRLRITERGATLRGWSHARTLLGSQLPVSWTSLLKRGVGRPLDWWSNDLLVEYTDLLLETYADDGIPPALAPLFVVAAAGIGRRDIPEDAVAPWDVLPPGIEIRARELLGVRAPVVESARLSAVESLRRAISDRGPDFGT
jgi:hypothetical protein